MKKNYLILSQLQTIMQHVIVRFGQIMGTGNTRGNQGLGIRLHGPLHCLGPRLLLAVDVEADCLAVRDIQLLLDHLPYPEDGIWLRGVCQPNGQLVSPRPHGDNCAVDLGK